MPERAASSAATASKPTASSTCRSKPGASRPWAAPAAAYSERVWDRMATELDEARLERYGMRPQTTTMVAVKRVEPISTGDLPVSRIVFDVANTGIRYQAGDRCGILPKNSPELVERTLQALRASGDEPIQLNDRWRSHVNLRDGYQNATELPLRALLELGQIRPVSRATALNLFELTHSERLRRILDAWAEDQWELWDLLDLLAEAGYNPRRLWKAIPGDQEHVCRIVPPEHWRLYSISSVQDDELHLTIGGLHYRTEQTDVSRGAERRGTGSSFLARLCAGEVAGRVSIKIVHPARFSLPADPSRPVVLLAGGTGISPMRSLIDQRMRTPGAGRDVAVLWHAHPRGFLLSARTRTAGRARQAEPRVAFSRDDVTAAVRSRNVSRFEFAAGERGRLDGVLLQDQQARLLWDLLRSPQEGGQGAYFYLCGRTSFASTILDSFKQIIARFTDGASESERDAAARQTLYRLIGEDRFLVEIFTTYAGAHFEDEQAAAQHIRGGAAQRRPTRLLDHRQRARLRRERVQRHAPRRREDHPVLFGHGRDPRLSKGRASRQFRGGRHARHVRTRRPARAGFRAGMGRRAVEQRAALDHAARCVLRLGRSTVHDRRDRERRPQRFPRPRRAVHRR